MIFSFARALTRVSRYSGLLGAALCALVQVAEAVAQGTTVTVVRSGQPAPGFPADIRFWSPYVVDLTASGQVLVSDWPQEFGYGVGQHYWLARPGERILVASLNMPSVNDLGEVAMVITNGSSDSGIWTGLPNVTDHPLMGIIPHTDGSTELPGSLTRVARPGDPAPGAPGAVYRFFDQNSPEARMSNSGQVAFRSSLTGEYVNSSNDQGIWMGSPGAIELVVREGQAAPGIPEGATFRSLLGGFLFNGTQVLFGADLMGPGITSSNRSSTWLGSRGTLTLLARAGDAAPGLGSGVTISHVRLADISDSGLIALAGGLSGPGITESNNDAIWLGTPGNLSLIAQEGDQAPGLPDGITISSIGGVIINSAGQGALRAGLAGPGVTEINDDSLWFGTPGNLSIVAREGDQVPGAAAGVTFTGFARGVQLNSAGIIAFHGAVSGPGVSDFNDDRLWLRSAAGLKLLHGGETINFSLNDAGQVAYSSYNHTTGMITVSLFTPYPVPGDYNRNGAVDAADYVVWRKTLGQVGAGLAADGNASGSIDRGDYDVWRSHFGQTAGSGATSSARANAVVPEPTTFSLAALTLMILVHRPRARQKWLRAARRTF